MMDVTDDREMSDPSLSDFYNDMNEHGGADYKMAGSHFVAEIDTHVSNGGGRVTLWKAVKHPTREGYAPPDGKPENRYAWDAVGRAEFDDYNDAQAEFVRIGTMSEAREFAGKYPYNGPRRSYDERVSGNP